MAGFIYIMSNPSFPNLLKIGKSNKDPTKYRAKELYSTGVPEPYKVDYYAFVEDETYLERILHKEFNEERVNDNREFFDISCETVVKFIRSSPDVKVHIKYEELLNEWNPASELDWDAEGEFEKVFGPPVTFEEIKHLSRSLEHVALSSHEEQRLIKERDKLRSVRLTKGHWYYDADANLLKGREASRRQTERDNLRNKIEKRINQIDKILNDNSKRVLVEKAKKILKSD